MPGHHAREVVGGVLGNQGACVIAKSYEMKAAGVRKGEPIWVVVRSGATMPLYDLYMDEGAGYDICDVRGKTCF